MATRKHPKMDRKLVAKMEPYEVAYLARKFAVPSKTSGRLSRLSADHVPRSSASCAG